MPAGKVVVITGNGKGKTTSALGRCFIGWLEGKNILVLQFIKGGSSYGELKAAERLGESFRIRQTGLGFIKGPDTPMDLHRRNAADALEQALREIKHSRYDIIVLDEINYAIHFGLLQENKVIEVINQKPDNLTLILTGRYAREKVIENADEVVELREIKHHARRGITARQGIEY